MKIDGTEQRRLTSRLTTSYLAWSPDGRRIAFTRNEEVGESTTFTDDDVFVIEGDGDDPRQLTPEQDGRSSGQPTWSPDGSEIAFVRGQSVASTVPSRFGGLFVMRADGSDVRRLTPDPPGGADTSPAWSPDGREIAFTRGMNLSSFPRVNMDIYVVDRAGRTPRRLTHTARTFETTPAWSPDGSRIAFARSTTQTEFDGRAAIYVMNRDGTGERLVLAHQYFAGTPHCLTWSPGGRTIAFETSPVLECTAIHLVEVASGRARPLTSCTRKRESALSPSCQPTPR
jgi:TolB protein